MTNKLNVILSAVLLSSVLGSVHNPVQHPCGNPEHENEFHPQVEALLSKMNLEEKIGQLVQINIGNLITDKKSLKLDPKLVDYYVNQKQVGSFLNNLADGTDIRPATKEQFLTLTNTLQKAYMKNRLKIPMVYGLDTIHGANYVYGAVLLPQQLATAATFNRDIAQRSASIAAKDTRAVGVHWNFSPILDVAVNKQWPRVYETFGEDPYLVSELGRATIIGYQGCTKNSLKRGDKVAATMKHFIGYSNSRSGRDVDGSWMGERIVNDYFRPPFQAAIDVGVATTMESYSDIDGDHLVNSKKYLVDLLRNKMKFKGTTVTDWGQIEKLYEPIHIASSQEDAVYRVMKLGSLDMSMVPNNANFTDHMHALLRKGKLRLAMIDNNVRRILNFKRKLGLLDSNGQVSDKNPAYRSIGSKADYKVALEGARESVILLKNQDNLLPLKKNAKLLVTGPTADSLTMLTGGWTYTWQGTDHDEWFQNNGTSILTGLKSHSSRVTHIKTVDIDGKPYSAMKSKGGSLMSSAQAAGEYDAIVVCLGENHYTELMGNINNMELPRGQLAVVEELVNLSDKPVILVLTQGRPRVFGEEIANASKAIITSFLAGPHSGQAIADIIFGTTNPSGKLPITYSNHNNDNTLNYYRRFNENFNPGPMWEFGHGLSFTSFKYSNLQLSKPSLFPWESIDVSVTVTNTGKVAGKEVVLMYLTDIFRSIAPEVKKLRGFEKTPLLQPNQSHTVKFTINQSDLQYAGVDNDYVVEAGNFTVTVGDQQQPFELFTTEDDGIHFVSQ